MFKVEFFVEDKHVAAIMHGLAGRALDLKVVPVVNAVPVGSKKQVQAESTASNKTELLIERLLAFPETVINSAQLKGLVEAIGGSSPNTYANVLVERKVLKRRSRGVFEIKQGDAK